MAYRISRAIDQGMTDEPIKSVQFHYIKGNQYRALHVDGAFGGITPNGSIHMAVFNERQPIPQVMEHSVKDGVLGELNRTEGKSGIVRELDACLYMTLPVAKQIRTG